MFPVHAKDIDLETVPDAEQDEAAMPLRKRKRATPRLLRTGNPQIVVDLDQVRALAFFFHRAEDVTDILGMFLPESVFSDFGGMVSNPLQRSSDKDDVQISRHLFGVSGHSLH
jgi:hypothetical protein